MTEKVTDISEARAKKEPPELIYECPECGCGLMWVKVNFVMVCANCGCEFVADKEAS